MLAPPGSSSARGKAGSAGSRRASTKVETPDDVIKKLQKLFPNKKCADCSSKLPSCVNLTVGSFVCMACAGIHRELNQRVKGVGHSSFTAEEAEFMKTMDNEKVNLIWLARYNPTVERLKPPADNTNQHQLKAWIRRKYYEKQWYAEPSGRGNASSQPQQQEQQPAPSLSTRQGSQPQPTMAQLPPKTTMTARQQKPTAPASNQMEFFAGGEGGGGNVPPDAQRQPQPAAADPFGDHSFPADFGSTQARAAFPDEQPIHQQQHHHDNFANFEAPPHQAQTQTQQPQNFANFDAAGSFGNLDQQPQQAAVLPAQMQPQPQLQNFASFNSPTREMSPRPPQAPPATQASAFHKSPPALPAMDHRAASTPSKVAAVAPASSVDASSLSKVHKMEFKVGQVVYYKTEGMAEIIKIHHDDDSEPSYTIKIFHGGGIEKQSTDAYLHLENPVPNLLQSICKKLSDQQLLLVYEFAMATWHNKKDGAVAGPATTGAATATPPTAAAAVPSIAPAVVPSQTTQTVFEPTAVATAPSMTVTPPMSTAPAAAVENDDDPFAHLGPADPMPSPPQQQLGNNAPQLKPPAPSGPAAMPQPPQPQNSKMVQQPGEQNANQGHVTATATHGGQVPQNWNMMQGQQAQMTPHYALQGQQAQMTPHYALQGQQAQMTLGQNPQMMMQGQQGMMPQYNPMMYGHVGMPNQMQAQGQSMTHQNSHMMHGQAGMPTQMQAQGMATHMQMQGGQGGIVSQGHSMGMGGGGGGGFAGMMTNNGGAAAFGNLSNNPPQNKVTNNFSGIPQPPFSQGGPGNDMSQQQQHPPDPFSF